MVEVCFGRCVLWSQGAFSLLSPRSPEPTSRRKTSGRHAVSLQPLHWDAPLATDRSHRACGGCSPPPSWWRSAASLQASSRAQMRNPQVAGICPQRRVRARLHSLYTASIENLRLFAQTRMQRVCRKDRAPRASPALTTGPPPLISSWVSRLAWPLALEPLEWPPRACWCPRAFTTAQLGASPQPTPSHHKHLRCHTQ